MNRRAPSATARTLIARSRRPGLANTAAAVLRLAGQTELAPPQHGPAPVGVAAAVPAPASALAPETTAPRAAAPQTPAPHAAAPRGALEAVVPTPAPQARAPGAPVPPMAPAGQPVRYQAAIERASAEPPPSGSSVPSPRPAAITAPAAPARRPAPGPPPAPVPAAVRTADTGRPPRDDAARPPVPPAAAGLPADAGPPVPPTAAAGPEVRDGILWPGPEGLARITGATPFVERARRPARSVASPDTSTVRPDAPPQPEPPTVGTPTPKQIPAVAHAPAGPRAAPAHPPVTIGEIHVHVTEPAAAAADPFSLLAPYAQGLTARRDGAR
jgi:hypothetical protein